jgi:hypothetical protein
MRAVAYIPFNLVVSVVHLGALHRFAFESLRLALI